MTKNEIIDKIKTLPAGDLVEVRHCFKANSNEELFEELKNCDTVWSILDRWIDYLGILGTPDMVYMFFLAKD